VTAPAPVFPTTAPAAWLDTSGLAQAGLALRPATDADLPFLRALYAQTRAAELDAVAWPEPARRAFCDGQFLLQHRHYAAHYVPAAFLVVLRAGAPVGRLTLHWTAEDLRIVDILLDTAVRGQGIGSTLLRWAQDAATVAGVMRLCLHVEWRNDGARRLYRRFGFREDAAAIAGTHRWMTWRPPEPSVS
jgi:ribosomal protein S18 acetylase RimI-like enzyme